jgi:hypothetical protein
LRRSAAPAPGREIITDLDSLTETEIAYDGKRFIVRSAPRPAADRPRRLGLLTTPNRKCSATPLTRLGLLLLFSYLVNALLKMGLTLLTLRSLRY